jgi:hypothetical protein
MAKITSGPPFNAASYPGGQGAESGRVHAEDVRDMVFDRSADRTPLTSMIREGESLFTKYFDHICDKLETISDPNSLARAEAGTSSAASDWNRAAAGAFKDGLGVTFKKRTRFQQYVQNFREDVEVHQINDYLRAFGVAREYSYQVAKKAKRLAIAQEKRILTDVFCCTSSVEVAGTQEQVGSIATDPTFMRPFMELLFVNSPAAHFSYQPNVYRAEDGKRINNTAVAGISTDIGLTTAGKIIDGALGNNAEPTIQRRIDEEMILDFAAAQTGNEDDPDSMFDTLVTSMAPWGHVGSFGSVTSPSGNLGALQMVKDMGLEVIKRAIRIIESNYGPAAVMATRWLKQAGNTGVTTTYTRPSTPIVGRGAGAPGYLWGLQLDMLERRDLRPFYHDPLPRQGDSTIGMILGDTSYDMLHPQSCGVVIGVNNR